MARKIFVNLPVKDLQRSIDFFTALGFSFNPQFTDEKATCMVISEDIYAMLLIEERFLNFTNKKIADAFTTTEVLLSLTCESREEVDSLVAKAIAAGGSAPNPKQEYDFMYGHGFQDLDGHIWEVFWMNPDFVEPQE